MAEKIHDTEFDDLEAAARRGIGEEIGSMIEGSELNIESVTLERQNDDTDDYYVEVVESPSYPGLITEYHLYVLLAVCTGLPSNDFCTTEYNDMDKRVKVKQIHFWKCLLAQV